MAQSGSLKIGHNFTGLSSFLLIEWVKATAPGTPVIGHVTGTGLAGQDNTNAVSVNYPAPHSEQTLLITELPAVWHLIRFWGSSDGVSKDVLLMTLAGDARTGAVYPIQRFDYIVGRGEGESGVWSDPVDGDNGLRDTRLQDQLYWVFERGTGPLLSPTEITDRSDDGGGFDFTDPDKQFREDGIYSVMLITRADVAGDDSGAPGSEDGIYPLTSDQDYDPLTMSGRTLVSSGAGQIRTLSIPNLLLVSDSRFKIQTHSGDQRNLIIQLDTGDTVRLRGQDVNKIIMGSGEEAEFLIQDNVMYVLLAPRRYDRLGERGFSRFVKLNSLRADGTQYAQADYPGVVELMDLEGSVSYTTWDTSAIVNGETTYPNRGYFGRDDTGGTFRVPDLRGQFLRGVTGATAGLYQHHAVGAHTHNAPVAPNGISPGANIYGRGGDSGSDANIENSGTGIDTETRPKNTQEFLIVFV